MAAANTALRLCVRAIARRRPSPALGPTRSLLPRRAAFTSTPLRWRAADESGEGNEEPAVEETPSDYSFVEYALNQVPADQRTADMEKELRDVEASLEDLDREMHKSHDDMSARLFREKRPQRDSFWFDEDDDDAMTHDIEGENFDEDDIPTMAHAKLDEVREHRHYARITAWEMPMLAKLAKPFAPPAADQVLRYRYTSYLGESHPAQRKVVVTFCPGDLGLSAEQELKLKKLAGVRYNPEKDMIKMSCESYDHQAQNKRFLSDQVDKLLEAARDPTDTFADIPLDLRHHPITPKPKFPVAWRLTDARRKELDEIRARAVKRDLKCGEEGKLVDGSAVLQQLLSEPAPAAKAPGKEKVLERVGARRR